MNYPAWDFHANPNLKPEESTGYDVGFEQSILANRAEFGATYFHNGIRNLISYAHDPFYPSDPNAFWSINISRAKIDGVETFVAFKLLSNVTLRTDYTYTVAMDESLHQELVRRPKHKASLGAQWQATEALSLSATLIHIGEFWDYTRDNAAVYQLYAPGYTVVNIAASYDLGGGLTAFSRIDNLFNEQYQDPTGFLRPGLGVFAGVKIAVNAADLGGLRN